MVLSWKLNEIVCCKLNPLRFCLPTIRKKFARVAYINKIAYCYSIIDANNRISLPLAGEANSSIKMFISNENELEISSNAHLNLKKNNESKHTKINTNPLDSFFPFDPYLLTRSKVFINKYYQEFQDVITNESDEDSDEDDEDDEEESEDDDNDDEGEDQDLISDDEIDNKDDIES